MADFFILKEKLLELAHLHATLAILHWDLEVNMPPKGGQTRAEAIALLAGIAHEKFITLNDDGLLSNLREQCTTHALSPEQEAVVREVGREFEREQKLPVAFIKELAHTTSEANAIWVQARKNNDFNLFLPALEKIIALKQKEAALVGYKDSPYEALLDVYEPNMSLQAITLALQEVKNFLIPLIQKIKNSPVSIDQDKIKGYFSIEKQQLLNRKLAEHIGFDFDAGRVDSSTHPFATSFHPNDVRITTRYDETDIFYSLSSTIHEVGHALYEQGLPPEHFGTPLAQPISLGIHESQSRMMENMIGKSKSFWRYFYPQLQQTFPKPFKALPLEEFYQIINAVSPSLIRTESDEVTYNLHIILRFEIEKELIEGSLLAKDLPAVWNAKIKEYFAIDVPTDTQGVLQDIHWAHGSFGYFPTYTLGNLYAAQFYAFMQKDLPQLENDIAHGQFEQILVWLRKNIHIHGKFYTASDLVQAVTKEPLNSQYFIDYIQNKYGPLYEI